MPYTRLITIIPVYMSEELRQIHVQNQWKGVLTRALMEYSRHCPPMGGGRFGTLCYLLNYWTDSRSENGIRYLRALNFRICCKILSEHHWWREGPGQRSDFWLSMLASPGKAAVSDWNKADGMTWIVSGILLSTLLSLLGPCIKSRLSKVTRTKRSNLKCWVWWFWYMFLDQIFVKNEIITLEHFLNAPNRTKFENKKKCRNPLKKRRRGPFWAFKTAKLSCFSK